MQRIVLLATALLSLSAVARPKWIEKNPSEDTQYRYYIGRSGPQEDEHSAYVAATEDAYTNAIRENFGVMTEVELQSYESENGIQVSKRSQNKTGAVFLRGFQQIDSHLDEASNHYSAWALFRYKKSEIEDERARVKGKETGFTDFSEVGNKAGRNTGVLEVITEPAGANIRIDGSPLHFQRTPLRIYGVIPVGHHKIEIDHPGYEVETQAFNMMFGQKKMILKRLRPAKAILNVETIPDGAKVYLDGKYRGKTPLKNMSLTAQKEYRLELRHKDTETVSQTVTLIRQEERNLVLPLSYTGEALIRMEAQREQREREEKEESRRKLFASYGSNSATSYLYPVSIPEPKLMLGLNAYIRSPTIPEFQKPTFSLGASIHKRMSIPLGIEGELMYGISKKVAYSNGSVQQQTLGLKAGIGYYPIEDSHFYLEPELVYFEHYVEAYAGQIDLSGAKSTINQMGFGAGATWLSFSEVGGLSKPLGWGIRGSILQLSNGPLCVTFGVSILNFGL